MQGCRRQFSIAILLATSQLGACLKSNSPMAAGGMPAPTPNVVSLTVDSGPAGATGAINHAYVTVKVCASGNQSECASIDHVLLDTGSFGLRLVGSVLMAHAVTLAAETDAQSRTIEECVSFNGGQTWGPVALADVTLAGESALKLPIQVMDDTGSGAPPPAGCGANGTLINGVTGFSANGLLGIGVLIQDCGQACAGTAAALPFYYGCSAAGACSAENVPLNEQVANPVAMFAADNTGVVIQLPNLANANGDATVQGELIFGIDTQADNSLPTTGVAVLGANSSGDFTATYNGGTTALPALIDSATDAYSFNDPTIGVCSSGAFVGYYCPAVAPLSVFAVNTGVGAENATSAVDFALGDPNAFVSGAAAFTGLGGGGGSTSFIWGMPFFYGRAVYIGFEQRVSGPHTGPFYAY